MKGVKENENEKVWVSYLTAREWDANDTDGLLLEELVLDRGHIVCMRVSGVEWLLMRKKERKEEE